MHDGDVAMKLCALALCLVTSDLFSRGCWGAENGDSPIRVETVLIEGGQFTMGTPIQNERDAEYHDDEAPLAVEIQRFRLGKYPVTAEQVCLFLNSPAAKRHERETLYNHRDLGGYAYSTVELTGDDQYVPRKNAARAPANQVTWKGAVLFCAWLGGETGREYRLPSEAEWELAARGKALRRWPWGEEAPGPKHGPRYSTEELLNSQQLADRMRQGRPTWPTTPVGSHPANATPEGIHDMLGYVIGEWCADKYAARRSTEVVSANESDLADMKSDRVVRGYFHRPNSRPPLLPLGEWPQHGGRAWTRAHAHPLDAVQQAARYGFRVAEGVPAE
jgi:formylglycine-generating enzyme required for sulfatase activity